jgi:hypothetical protein
MIRIRHDLVGQEVEKIRGRGLDWDAQLCVCGAMHELTWDAQCLC